MDTLYSFYTLEAHSTVKIHLDSLYFEDYCPLFRKLKFKRQKIKNAGRTLFFNIFLLLTTVTRHLHEARCSCVAVGFRMYTNGNAETFAVQCTIKITS